MHQKKVQFTSFNTISPLSLSSPCQTHLLPSADFLSYTLITRSSTRRCNRKLSSSRIRGGEVRGWWGGEGTLSRFPSRPSPPFSSNLRSSSSFWCDQAWAVGHRSRHVEGRDIVCCCRPSKLRLVCGQQLRQGNLATTGDPGELGLLPVHLLDQRLAALLDLGEAFRDVLLLQRPVSPQLLDLLREAWGSLLGIVTHLKRECDNF